MHQTGHAAEQQVARKEQCLPHMLAIAFTDAARMGQKIPIEHGVSFFLRGEDRQGDRKYGSFVAAEPA
jgi:hypothetical protein